MCFCQWSSSFLCNNSSKSKVRFTQLRVALKGHFVYPVFHCLNLDSKQWVTSLLLKIGRLLLIKGHVPVLDSKSGMSCLQPDHMLRENCQVLESRRPVSTWAGSCCLLGGLFCCSCYGAASCLLLLGEKRSSNFMHCMTDLIGSHYRPFWIASGVLIGGQNRRWIKRIICCQALDYATQL